MHQLVPPFILNNFKAGTMNGSFQAVGLFVDTSGFTAMTDVLMSHGQHGAEILAEVIHATFNPMMQAVFEQGGFITSQEGDAFLALFPVQKDSIECSQRALSTAIQIQNIASKLSIHTTPYGEFTIRVKVGLGIGEAEWAIIPSADGKRAAFYFRGEAARSSTEAEGHASPGQIVMDPGFFSQAQPDVLVDPVDHCMRLLQYNGRLAGPQPVVPFELDLELASHFFPRELFTWNAIGEFRQVANLFVSLPTIRTGAQLALFMQTLFKLQDRYGGLLSRVGFGDKGPHLMLFWGAPIAYENDLDRLFNFILELQTQTAIPINAAVSYRIAHAGFIGSDLAEDFAPFGRGPNLAARFMTSAPRGEIWVDEFAAQRASLHFALEYVGEFTFKGFAQPQKVYNLVDRKAELDNQSKGTLVGREDELEVLDMYIHPIFSGESSGVMIIWGEPGMGKTSLIQEFMSRLQRNVHLIFKIFTGQSDEILRQPFNPFRYWLRKYFDVSDSQREYRNKRTFNRKVDELINLTLDTRLANELDRTRSFLGAMVDLYWLDSLYEELDAKGRYENTILGLIALLQAESRQQPVIFLLEDAHWLDDDSKAFLPRLLRMMTGDDQAYPFAMLITSRTEGVDFAYEDLPNRRISLDRLNPAALAALSAAILEGPASDDLMDLLDEQGEGNPFFTEQLLQYLKVEQLLIAQDGQWGVIPRHEFTLPTGVGSLLVARLDRLALEVKEVVQTASILGHEFELNLLTEMLRNQSMIYEKVAVAEKEKIWSMLDQMRYIFRHVLLQNAAYQMQIHSRRQALHRLAFEALEKVYPDHPKHLYGDFAYHAEQGGLTERALYYLALAGKEAQDGYLNQLAEGYFSRALVLTPENDGERRFKLLLARETTYDMQGKNGLRRHDLDELEVLASQFANSEKNLEVLLRKSYFLINTGAFSDAALLAQKAVELALSIDSLEKVVVGYRYIGFASLRQNLYDIATSVFKKGLEIAVKIGNKWEEGLILNNLGLIALEQNRLDLAGDYFMKCLLIAQQTYITNNQSSQGDSVEWILNNLGTVADRRGNYGTAINYYERSLEVTRKKGDRAKEGLVLANMGWIHGVIGDYSAARAYTDQNIKIAREVGDPYVEAYGLINLSSYAVAIDDHSTAADHALNGQTLARRIGDRSCEAWALTNLGHAQFGLGKYDEAIAAFESALAIRVELDQPVLAAELLAGLAWVYIQLNDKETASQRLGEIMSRLEQGDLVGTDDPVRVYLISYRVLKANSDPRAANILEKGHQFLQTRAEKFHDETSRRMFMENVPSHRDLAAEWKSLQ